jgi:hypothetical protein
MANKKWSLYKTISLRIGRIKEDCDQGYSQQSRKKYPFVVARRIDLGIRSLKVSSRTKLTPRKVSAVYHLKAACYLLIVTRFEGFAIAPDPLRDQTPHPASLSIVICVERICYGLL